MDYSHYSEAELETMLDKVVFMYKNGDMHRSLYTIEFNALYDALAEKKKNRPKPETPEDAYKRAMQGVC